MIAENRHTQVMCRIVVVAILLLCALAVMARAYVFTRGAGKCLKKVSETSKEPK